MLRIIMHRCRMKCVSFCVLLTLFGGLSHCYAKAVPKIQKFNFEENVMEGSVVSVMCMAVSSSKPLTFQWYKDGALLDTKSEGGVRMEQGSEFSILILDGVGEQSEGNYTCAVSNREGSARHSAYLRVRVPPKWTKVPVEVFIVSLGDSISVECQASGSPKPRIQWKKYTLGKDRNSAPLHNEGDVLKFQHVSYEDAGMYECVAYNHVDYNISANFSLMLRVPAKFEEKFSVVNVKKGDSGRMKCEAIGDQPLSITWQRDDATITKTANGDQADQRYEIFETMVPKGVVSELIIRTSDKDDGALYTCIAENEFGNDHRKIRLLVLEVPAPPLDVKIREIWSRSASVSWAPPYSGNSPITKYIVQYWRDLGGAPHRLIEISVPSSQSSAIMKDLHPGAAYILKVVAENAVGRGEPSDAAAFRTGEEEPSSPPSDIIAEPRGSSTIRVSWKPPPKDSLNGELRSYYVGYKVRDSNQPYSYKTVDYVADTVQEFFLTNLLKASDYSVVVKASNAAGSGPPSHEMYVRTLDGGNMQQRVDFNKKYN